jgi:hypothetical protein
MHHCEMSFNFNIHLMLESMIPAEPRPLLSSDHQNSGPIPWFFWPASLILVDFLKIGITLHLIELILIIMPTHALFAANVNNQISCTCHQPNLS